MNKASFTKLFAKYILYLLLFISISGLFLSFWSSFVASRDNQFVPLAFLLISYILLVYFAYRNESIPANLTDEAVVLPQNKADRMKSDANTSISIDSSNLPIRIIGNINAGDREKNARNILKNLAHEFKIMQGVFYIFDEKNDNYRFIAAYALPGLNGPEPFVAGVGIHGQAVLDKKIIEITHLSSEQSMILSGLGSTNSKHLYLLPLQFKNEVLALIEFSTLKPLQQDYIAAINQKLEQMGTLWAELNNINEG
jgi:hypothetical protein